MIGIHVSVFRESRSKPAFDVPGRPSETQLGTIDFDWAIVGVFADEFDAGSLGSATVERFEEDAAIVEFGENNIAVVHRNGCPE